MLLYMGGVDNYPTKLGQKCREKTIGIAGVRLQGIFLFMALYNSLLLFSYENAGLAFLICDVRVPFRIGQKSAS